MNNFIHPDWQQWAPDDPHQNLAGFTLRDWQIFYDNWMIKESPIVDNLSLGLHEIKLLSKISLTPNAKALDIGCASGRLLMTLKSKGIIAQGTGIDISPLMVSNANAGLGAFGLDELLFFNSRLEDYETVDKYDLIIADEVLEHFYNVPLALDKIINLLSGGGYFIGTTPHLQTCNATPHLHYFDEESLRGVLSDFFGKVYIELMNYHYTPTIENHLLFVAQRGDK